MIVRPRDRWSESAALVQEHGHQAVCAAVVKVEYARPKELPEALQDLRSGHVGSLVFASVTAVKSLARAAPECPSFTGPSTEVVAIGPPTAQALRELGFQRIRMPEEYTSEGLLELLGGGQGEVVMLRSDHGNSVLRDGLKGKRTLRELVMYSLQQDHDDSLDRALELSCSGNIDAVLHTSSLSAKLVVERSKQLYGEGWKGCWSKVNAAIGHPTKATLEGLGVQVHVVPDNATFPELVRAVDLYLKGRESN
jgi:uroporphyrinogen-III synthase